MRVTHRLLPLALALACIALPTAMFAANTNTPAPYDKLKINWTDLPSAIDDNVHSAIKSMVTKLNENKTKLPQSELNKLTKKTMLQAIEPYGYYSPQIVTHHTHKDGRSIIDTDINLRTPVKVRHITIHIPNKTSAWKNLANSFPLKTGDILTTEAYKNYKSECFQLASDLGYFNAEMSKSTITINRKQHWADIAITFNPHKRFTYGKTIIHSNFLKESFLKRFLPYRPGSLFTNSDITTLQTNLQNTEYFSYLEVIPKPNSKTNQVDIHIYAKTAKRYKYIFGAGYGSDTGMRGTIGMQVLPVNRRGHTFQILSKLAVGYSLIDGTYAIPGKDPVNTQYSAFTRVNQNNLPFGSSLATQFGVAYKHIYHPFEHHILTQVLQLYSLHENSTYTQQSPAYQNMAIAAVNFTFGPPVSSLGVTQIFQWTLGALTARKGLGSYIDLTQFRSSLFMVKLLKEKWRIVVGNEMAINQAKNLYDIPISMQLATGGNNSVRGYPYASIGPGRYLSTATITLQREILKDWYLGAFYDMGSASNQFFTHIKQSAGPTLTRSTPIGGLSFSLAKPINDPNRKHWGFSFSWGTRL